MSKRAVYCVGIILLCFLVAAVIMVFIGGENSVTAEQEPSGITQQQDDSIYIVKEYNGKIAVFYQNDETPFRILEKSIDSLPQADRDMLKSGLSVTGESELRRLIEDYTG